MTDKFLEMIFDKFSFRQEDIRQMNPLVLAYIGDAVYEMFIRTYLISCENMKVNKFHLKSINYVKAKAQALVLDSIIPILNEEELYIVKRGRNAKSGTIPKNSTIKDYKWATAFETLIGHLYLNQKHERLIEILNKATLYSENTDNKKENDNE